MSAKQNKGFTLIELVLVLVVFGVAGVMTIPDYLDSSAQALMQAKWEKSGEVKALHHEITDLNKTYPSVAYLAGRVAGMTKPLARGIELQVDGENYVIPTYSNSRCTMLTESVDDTVACVGTIPS